MKNYYLILLSGIAFLLLTLGSCQKQNALNEITVLPNDQELDDRAAIPAIDSDTLVFTSEKQFRKFLVYHDLAYYTVAVPVVNENCNLLPSPSLYPAQLPDDYLHEDRFTGLPFISIFDHIITRKNLNIFFPTYYDHYGYTDTLTFCDVRDCITHPITGQVVCFENTFNWKDENGQNIFNINKKLWLLWGFNFGVVSFDISRIHLPTGIDYTFVDFFPAHTEVKLNFNGMDEVYGYLKE